MRDEFDLKENRKYPDPWEYVDMPPPVPTVEAGPNAFEWRRLSEAEKLALIAARRV